jgi:O-antigen/teichoic acid export membrane protein
MSEQPPPEQAVAPTGGARRIVKNFASLSLSGMTVRFIMMLIGIVGRRVMGVAPIGQIAWTGAVLSYFNLPANIGLETIARREVAKDHKLAERYTLLLAMVQVVVAAISITALLGIAHFAVQERSVRILLAAQAVSLLFAPLSLSWVLLAFERMTVVAVTDVLTQVIVLGAVILLIHKPSDTLLYVIIPYPVRLLFLGVIAYYTFHLKTLKPRELFKVKHPMRGAFRLAGEALPIGLSQVAIQIYYNCDAIMLGHWQGDATVGYYSTAYSIMLVGSVIAVSMHNAFFPAVTRAGDNPGAARRVNSQYLRALCWAGCFMSACGFAFGRWIVVLLYGHAFDRSGPMLEWLSIDLFFICFNLGFSRPLVAWGRQKIAMYLITMAGASNLVLNLLLIPRYGTTAAIATTILAEVLLFVGTIPVRRKLHPVPWLRIAAVPLFVCAVAAAVGKSLALRDPRHWIIYAAATVLLLGGVFVAMEGRQLQSLRRA